MDSRVYVVARPRILFKADITSPGKLVCISTSKSPYTTFTTISVNHERASGVSERLGQPVVLLVNLVPQPDSASESPKLLVVLQRYGCARLAPRFGPRSRRRDSSLYHPGRSRFMLLSSKYWRPYMSVSWQQLLWHAMWTWPSGKVKRRCEERPSS